jgi:hypothetical protein
VTDVTDSDRSPADRIQDIPRILHALRDSVQDALLDHKRVGNPVAIWKDGRVEWVQPEDIPETEGSRGKE